MTDVLTKKDLDELIVEVGYEGASLAIDQAMDILGIRAKSACISVWSDFDETEIKTMPAAVRHVWAIGRDLATHIALSNHFYATVSPPKEDEHLSPNDK